MRRHCPSSRPLRRFSGPSHERSLVSGDGDGKKMVRKATFCYRGFHESGSLANGTKDSGQPVFSAAVWATDGFERLLLDMGC